MKIEEEPLFHMDELNPKLYEHINSIQEVKVNTSFNSQLNHLFIVDVHLC